MPPSIAAVIYATAAAVSTGTLFAASVIPAYVLALGLCVYIVLRTARRRTSRKSRSTQAGTRERAQPSSSSTMFEWLGQRRGRPILIVVGIVLRIRARIRRGTAGDRDRPPRRRRPWCLRHQNGGSRSARRASPYQQFGR
jgi:TRAP-type C4-dicarboxylate transport system permease large subunit